MHQRQAVAPGCLVHEMRGDEDRHGVLARQFDQEPPEFIARDGVDARCRLVEDQQVRLVDDRHREREPLADAEREVRGETVDVLGQIAAVDQFRDPPLGLRRRQMKQPRMQHQVLPHGELAIQREGLRHVADAAARFMIAGLHRAAENQRLAGARGQQPGQHLHRRGLAAAIRSDEAEDLAFADLEVHAVDGGEVGEPAGLVARDDDRLLTAIELGFLRHVGGATIRPLRQQRDEGRLDRASTGLRLELGRRTGRQYAPLIHRDQPVEPLGLLHIGGGDDDTHAGGAARAQPVDQIPELAPRQRIDPGGGLIQDQEVRIVDQRAAQAELLLHAAGELFRRPVGEVGQRRRLHQLGDAPVALGSGLAEQTGEERDVLTHAQIRIEILAEPLRHVGDARADLFARAPVGHVGAEHDRLAALDRPRAGQDRQQRGFADAVRSDQSDHVSRGNRDRDVIERHDIPVALRDLSDDRDRAFARGHGAACRRAGHARSAFHLTYATPGNPLRTASACAASLS